MGDFPNLSDSEQRVLEKLAACGGEYSYSFDTIMTDTGLIRPVVQTACRSLKKKGLAMFFRGLMDDDGNVAGSGYTVTVKGVRIEKQYYDHVW